MVSEAWHLIRQAAAQDWSRIDRWTGHLDGAPIVVRPGGQWQSQAPIDEYSAAWLNRLLEIATWQGPLVIAQLGQTLDGKIATESGDSFYINGLEARGHLHALRALVDAVIIGAGTAVADQPQLTVRHLEGRNPVRVIIDPNARVPLHGPLFESGPDAPAVLQLVAADARPIPAPAHVERIVLEADSSGFRPSDVLDALARRGLHRVLVEGGATTVSRFLSAGALNRLHLLIAPLILGSGRDGISMAVIDRLADVRRWPIRSWPLADELLVSVSLD